MLHGLGERADAFLGAAGRDVLLLELAVGLEQDHRHLGRQVVLQIRADLLIRALGVAGDPLEVLLAAPDSSKSRSGRSCRCTTRTCRSGCCSCRSTAPSAFAPRRWWRGRRRARPRAARRTNSGLGSGTRVRIGRYLGKVGRKPAAILLLRHAACKHRARQFLVQRVRLVLCRRRPRPLSATSPYTGPPMRACHEARFGGQPRGLPAVARSSPGARSLACQAEARATTREGCLAEREEASAKAGIDAALQGFT